MLLGALLFLSPLLGGNHQGTAEPTTVILVRHAEKVDESDNPHLSAMGRKRAKDLVRALSGVELSRIYTTPFFRTNETAEPVASAKGLEPIVITSGKTYAADLAARIRAEDAGETVLVVGHSNSTRDLLRALGIADPPAIGNSQYDDLFVCTIGADGNVSLVPLRYGATAR